MNRLVKFTIENFRKFDKLVIKFEEGNYFIISGQNGTGKTSILEAINICFSNRSSKYSNVKETDFYSDKPIILSAELKDYFFLEFEGRNYKRLIPCKKFTKTISRRTGKEINKIFSSSYDVKNIFKPENFNPDKEEYKSIKNKFSILNKDQFIVRSFEEISLKKFNYTIESNEEPETIEHIGYRYMAKVLLPETFYYDNMREKDLLQEYSTTFANIINEIDWRYKKDLLKDKKKVLDKYDQLKKEINNINDYKEELLKPAKDIIKNELKLGIKTDKLDFYYFDYHKPYFNSIFGIFSDKEQIIPAQNFGSGLSILLALSISISFSRKSKNPVIILIDEPELHLQANLQKKLSLFLKNSKDFQSIVCSHSHLFIEKDNTKNNIILEEKDNDVELKYCDCIDITDLHFRLLGNSIDDLFVPENILLVEGIHDKNILSKCLCFTDKKNLQIQIVPVGGKDNMPDKSELYREVIDQILVQGKWYSDHIVKILKIIVDGDVTDGKIDNWVKKYSFDKEKQIKKITDNGIEYLFPEFLIKECTKNTVLNDGEKLANKTKNEILSIIFKDNKKDSNDTNYTQTKNRISKLQLNEYINSNITKEIFNSNECTDLRNLIKWI